MTARAWVARLVSLLRGLARWLAELLALALRWLA
jgi:hypothetical protein